MEIILNLITVICICAASGFRIFVPYLILSISGKIGILIPPGDSLWIYSDIALYIFIILAVLEITGYFTPWIDNMLDLISTPLALISGTVLGLMFLADFSPALRAVTAFIIGGGAAVNIQFLTVKSRSLSSVFPEGNGNTIVSFTELISSVLTTVLVIISPPVSFAFLILIVILLFRNIIFRDKKAKTANQISY
ncbi:MAG: DUF4126 domain-containing protein [Ignavibacteria bacterium]|nr:DUF4126 domain-containing protein [Ignavibacteria bacterium]